MKFMLKFIALIDVDKDELVRVTSLTSNEIIKAKEKYFHFLGNKLNDPQTDAKSYWSIPNKLLQMKNSCHSTHFIKWVFHYICSQSM